MALKCDVLVIAGPTASGKTAVGIALAQALNGEIISADARQIYRYMDIGTAKPTLEERKHAKHHLIDQIDPNTDYSAGQFAKDATAVMQTILQAGKVPIVVGGAGLYLKALFDGFSPMPEIPNEIRAALQSASLHDLASAYAQLKAVDPEWAAKIQPSDRQRIVRGLEVFEATGKTLTFLQAQPAVAPEGHWRPRWFGLRWPRGVLYERINARSEQMLGNGLLEEARGLLRRGYTREMNALKTFGYRECFDHLDGNITAGEALTELQKATRHYAKRQVTWFGRNSRISWIEGNLNDPAQEIIRQLEA
jgi:tRNA dimethylallyltransferase